MQILGVLVVMLDAAYEKNADIVAGKFLRFVEKNGREVQTIDRKLESHGLIPISYRKAYILK